jgi:TonB-dependent SusC/RagA subfamily outer membrane receptor
MTTIKCIFIFTFVVAINATLWAQQNTEQQSKPYDQSAFKSTINLDPLFKIDSVELSREEFERAVALGDIESVLVLKDSNLTALYGEKARSGVVIVITRDRASFAEELLSRKKRIYPSID